MLEGFDGNQSVLAKRLGVAQPTVSDALNHGAGGTKLLLALARLTGAHVDDILTGEAMPGRTIDPDEELPAPRDRHEVEHVDPRHTGPGRWKYLAARYWTFRRQATLADEAGLDERALDLAADELGEHSGDGPTEEQARAAIDRAASDLAAARSRRARLPEGREATAADFEVPAPAPRKRR